ncbi:hypothetical protein [Akkermansia glycaniphila]|nr:hypothetical protein [Akkermansia glycaniphila]
MNPAPLMILPVFASVCIGGSEPYFSRNESLQEVAPQSVMPVDDRLEQVSDCFGVQQLFIPDIRHWLTCEIVEIQPQKDDALLMTCRFTNHSNHEITVLNYDSIVEIENKDRQVDNQPGHGRPLNMIELFPCSFFGSDAIWYRNNQYCWMEEQPEWTIKPSVPLTVTMTLRKNNPEIDPEADEWEVSLYSKSGKEETVTYVDWPLLEMGNAYPDAMYFLFSIPRVRIETGQNVIPYQTGIYATIPPPYRRPFPYEVEAHYMEPPLVSWENVDVASEYDIGVIKSIDSGRLPSFLNALIMVSDRTSADTCTSNLQVEMSIYIEAGDIHAELDKTLTECQLSRTATQYLHYRWSIMQRQIGQVLDELEKVDYYGSDKLKAMSPVIRKECASFLATLEKYLHANVDQSAGSTVCCLHAPRILR